jgi:hypothetical protein
METNNPNQHKTDKIPDCGSYAQPAFFLSDDGNWVRVVWNGQQIGSFHRHFFLKLLGIPFVPKMQGLKKEGRLA